MNELSIPVASPASASDELRASVQRLHESLKASIGDEATVELAPFEKRDDGYDRTIKVLPRGANAWVEVDVSWDKGAPQAAVEVSDSSAASRRLGFVPLAVALALGFVADRHAEWLPVLRGIRVAAGATTGLALGFMLVALLSALGVGRSAHAKELAGRVERLVANALAR